ncbi:MAG: peptidylprolyl isomerase [Archaeoglobaceae archaeon]|nr:peptidylprolyl isomerase [Archaeoglobaceae archaeon]MDW8014009.1 peptidylprolyl isomerase [Archaeoglobaceae archaeon]
MIAKGDFVKLSYTAKLEDGTVIDTTIKEVAEKHGIYNENTKYGDIYVVVGEGHVLSGLDEDLIGKEVGYKGTVTVPPEKGFGNYDPNKKDTFSITKFTEKPKIGQRVRIGEKIGTVERIIGRKVLVDFNHPFAGKTIKFEYEIKDKVEKLEDKIRALFTIYTGVEIKNVTLKDKKAVVEVSTDSYLNQLFLIGRYKVAKDAFRFLDIEELEIVEKFNKEALKTVEEKSQKTES